MRLQYLSALTLFAALVGGTAKGGSISIVPTTTTITVGQTVDFTVDINSTDPTTEPGPNDLVSVYVSVNASGPLNGLRLSNFTLAPGLPAGSFLENINANGLGSAIVGVNNNHFSSFNDAVYGFTVEGYVPGTYTFAVVPGEFSAAVYVNIPGQVDSYDLLSGSSPATLVVAPMGIPEPAGLTLAGVCFCGLALKSWRRRAVRRQ
jgi:hypothetical protein